MWVRAHFETADNPDQERRRAPRRKLLFGAEIGRDGTRVIVHDLSTWGLKFETSAEMAVGERIEVLLPDGPVEAIVVWCDGHLCGGTFTQPISEAAINAALLRSQLVSGNRRQRQTTAGHGSEFAAAPLRAAAAQPAIFTTAGALLVMLVLLLVLSAFAGGGSPAGLQR